MKNDREQLEMLLCRYLDGDLNAQERADMDRLLEQDAQLREELSSYRALDEQLKQIDAAQLDAMEIPDIDYEIQRGHIMEAVERKALLVAPLRKRFFLFRPVYASIAVAAVVLIAASVGFMSFLGKGEPGAAVSVSVIKPVTEGQVNVAVLPSQSGTVQVDYPRVDMMDLPLGASSDTLSASAPPSGTVAASVAEVLRPGRRSSNGGAMGPMSLVD